MATTQEINAICDVILQEFDADPAVFRTSMRRVRLMGELDAINSQIRKRQNTEDSQNAAFQEAMATLSAALAAKEAELDTL